MAVGLARLGHEVGFVGKVGAESFGDFLVGVLRENHVDVSGMAVDYEARTMLAFVSLTHEGERDFMFYHPSADMRLTPENSGKPCANTRNLSLWFRLTNFRALSQYNLSCAANCRKAGCLISYDPNLPTGTLEK